MSPKKILITGAAGLIGSHLLARLVGQPNCQVMAVDYKKEPQVTGPNIAYASIDLSRLEHCQEVVKNIDFAIMLAAKIDRRPKNLNFVIDNLALNFQMLEAAYQAGIKKVVWLSSATGYPPLDRPAREEDMFNSDPADSNFAVGWMNRYLEIMCRMYAAKFQRKMSTIIFRPTAVYGEYGDFSPQTCHVLPALVHKTVRRQDPLEVWGSGDTVRDFIYAGDVADACLLALDKIEGHEVFNLGSGQPVTVRKLLALILELGKYAEARVEYLGGDTKPAPSIQVDMSKINQILKYSPKVSLREGLTRSISWYRKQEVVHV